MKAELFKEINGRFLLNELGHPHFVIHKIQMAHGRVQNISILRKVKNSALWYFYLNAEKEQQGTYARGKFFHFSYIYNSCSTKIVYNAR